METTKQKKDDFQDRVAVLKKSMKDMLKAHDNTDYNLGVYNGMEHVLAFLEDRDPVYMMEKKEKQNMH